ncbi:putative ABC transport system membrane protein [Saccharopolyspora subtropica]|uniref:ABC transport system membrane protein n=1 Tax=Saccharopolyspora thermophila TaxID=89367 RepID=A0A917JVT7_9PSEU|nr:MFS transporter [Saccharopolyspora subtropica]GGI89656.1 putative ABC transport system membrane protein [Saccharopolyspora subtropica]
MRTWRLIRSFPPALQLLLVNQFGVNTGFYLLVPYLAGYLGHALGASAAVVGLVLGVRTLSQQGLFLLGGSAADRWGARGVIVAGCALRAVGFALFAFGTSLPVLLLASALSGLAGALFNPAVRTYLAQEAGDRRAEAFSLFNVFANTGALLGPLLGSALIAVGFQISALVAAVIFAVLTIAQVAVLPVRRVPRPANSVFTDWRVVLADRRFLAFTAALTGLFALHNQLYLVLPMQAERFTGSPGAVAAVFVVATVATLVLQVRVTDAVKDRWRRGRSIAVGLAVMGAGFAATAAAAAVVPAAPAADPRDAAVRLLPVLLTAFLLALGVMVAQPFVYELIPSFGRAELAGTYFGVFYVVSGITAAAGNALIGWLTDLAGREWSWLPATLCVLIGLSSAAAVLVLDRRGGIVSGTGGFRCAPPSSARTS